VTRCLVVVHERNLGEGRTHLVPAGSLVVARAESQEAEVRNLLVACQADQVPGNRAPSRPALLEAAEARPCLDPCRTDSQAAWAHLVLLEVHMAHTDMPGQAQALARQGSCRPRSHSCPVAYVSGHACGGAGGCAPSTGYPAPLCGACASASSCAGVSTSRHRLSSWSLLQRSRSQNHFVMVMLSR